MILLIERRRDGTSVPSLVSPAPTVRTDIAVGAFPVTAAERKRRKR